MRLMSFALTWPQVLEEIKDVTRRFGFEDAKPGDRFLAVKKARGVPIEKRIAKGPIEVITNTLVRLGDITPADVRREGFGSMTPGQFVAFFCLHMPRDRRGNKTTADTEVNRIEYFYVKETP